MQTAVAEKTCDDAARPRKSDTLFDHIQQGNYEKVETYLKGNPDSACVAENLLGMACAGGWIPIFELIERELRPQNIEWVLMFSHACRGGNVSMMKYVIGREPEAVKTRMRIDIECVGKYGDKEVITKVANAMHIVGYFWLGLGACAIKDWKRMETNQTIVHDLYDAALERENLPYVNIMLPREGS
uniref:Uncharacterized protein n=1 Tax=Marseillevirus LCMAC103 TaxID=2506604 RepID=A0A481YV03_9VIRU|nr:MAG: hypothetical protein LCMAC103_03720 [Marseillevirus LCMAC103]